MCKRIGKVKIFITTVAGSSTRFSKSLGKEVLKCIYYKESFSESLLYRMLSQPVEFDKYIIVGGYKFEELKTIIKEKFQRLKEAFKYEFDEIVFAEGDLFVDTKSFVKVCNTIQNVITYNSDPILAKKAVVFYFDEKRVLHYIYDISHNILMIHEPFISIYNSGQLWKFVDRNLLQKIYYDMNRKEWQGTNLVMIEKYFRQLPIDNYELIRLNNWINCNTIEDFKKFKKENLTSEK